MWTSSQARPWLALVLAAAVLPSGARSEAGGLRGAAPVANTTVPAVGSMPRINGGLNQTISAAGDTSDQDQVVLDQASIEDILEAVGGKMAAFASPTEASLDAVRQNLSSFAEWDFSRCRSYPWELHCLPASQVCPSQPWLPQCQHAPAPHPTPRPEPAPAPAPVQPRGNIKTLYHQTSPDIAALILKSNFRPGTQGWCGGGIYFATTPEATESKCIGPDSHKGAILAAKVDVGNVLQMSAACDRSITGLAVKQRGYDSIEFNPGDGDEYVVFSPDRVTDITLYSGAASQGDSSGMR